MAALAYAPSSESITEHVHQLQVPLRSLRYAADIEVVAQQSLDRTVYEVASISSGGAYDLVGAVRYEQDPQSLIDVLMAGSRGQTLTYYPDIDDPDVNYPCLLMEPLGKMALAMDSQRGVLGDQEIEIRLRLTSPGPFDPLLHGTECLLWWQAGDSLAPFSVARASSGWYVDKGYGTLKSASTNIGRVQWMSSQGSSWVTRTFPVLLVESSGKNYVPNNMNLASTWTLANLTAPTSQADPAGSTALEAWFLVGTSSGLQPTLSVVLTAFDGSTFAVVSWYLRNLGLSTQTVFKLNNTSTIAAGSTKLSISVDWSSGTPAVSLRTANAGQLLGNPEPHRDGYWRCSARTTAAVSSSDSYSMTLSPSSQGSSAGTRGIYAYAPMVEI